MNRRACPFCGRERTPEQIRWNNCSCGVASGPYDGGAGYDRAGRQHQPKYPLRTEGESLARELRGCLDSVSLALEKYSLQLDIYPIWRSVADLAARFALQQKETEDIQAASQLLLDATNSRSDEKRKDNLAAARRYLERIHM